LVASGHIDGCRNIFIYLLAVRLITGAAEKITLYANCDFLKSAEYFVTKLTNLAHL